MNKKYLWAMLLLTFSIISLFLATNDQAAQAKPAFAVGLISFDATPLDNAVLLEWETGTEDGTAAFKLKRGENGSNFDYVIDSATGIDFIVNHQGDISTGASYEFIDETAVNNTTYTYILIELESNSNENEVDEVSVTVGVEPTATEVIIPSTSTSQATATPQEATATATTTSGSNATATAVPTNTSVPTATSSQSQSTAIPQPSNTPASGGDTQSTAVSNDTIKPTETLVAVGVEEITTDSSVAVAQAQEESAAYPAPIDSASNSAAIQQEDVAQAESNSDASTIGDSSVASINDSDANNPVAIGSDANSQQSTNAAYPAPETQEESEGSNGRTYLWGGFLVALLVFGVAVVGAILLYTRKQNPGA